MRDEESGFGGFGGEKKRLLLGLLRFFLSLFARDVVLLRSFRILPNVFGVLGDMFERAGKRRGIGEEEEEEEEEEEREEEEK